ncbi:hypothetical protein OEZ60_19070 [Defluviimonas sp. WL0024]|uniref:Uncharacterized protein n=2 Tax=Albidovulum TaxID=205889 RepID=A0ABT3J6V3_9RHOB|nr:hypothetical protein [Defluviimonas sp. WL0024]MCU9850100.1 hypothetical protein [Defluviimonas sp. WL0024]MCW3783425.1 hypothetical protein [Defluviimonas salinarum]
MATTTDRQAWPTSPADSRDDRDDGNQAYDALTIKLDQSVQATRAHAVLLPAFDSIPNLV